MSRAPIIPVLLALNAMFSQVGRQISLSGLGRSFVPRCAMDINIRCDVGARGKRSSEKPHAWSAVSRGRMRSKTSTYTSLTNIHAGHGPHNPVARSRPPTKLGRSMASTSTYYWRTPHHPHPPPPAHLPRPPPTQQHLGWAVLPEKLMSSGRRYRNRTHPHTHIHTRNTTHRTVHAPSFLMKLLILGNPYFGRFQYH
jgi:hypothetical protein